MPACPDVGNTHYDGNDVNSLISQIPTGINVQYFLVLNLLVHSAWISIETFWCTAK